MSIAHTLNRHIVLCYGKVALTGANLLYCRTRLEAPDRHSAPGGSAIHYIPNLHRHRYRKTGWEGGIRTLIPVWRHSIWLVIMRDCMRSAGYLKIARSAGYSASRT